MDHKGFTLIELLVVVVIVGILAAIGIPKLANSKHKAYVSAMKSDLRNLMSAQEAFFSDSSHYSSNIALLSFKNTTGTYLPTLVQGSGYWTATNSHTQLANTSCGIAIGTSNPLVAGASEGEPVCRP
jgi:prepilin-type N-terminal cleavage/methylation domain-containing protein